jgi:hypothetical protein
MRYTIAICALTVSASAVATPFSEGLAVETESPDALCPDLATTRDAIHHRLGTLALAGEQRGWTARYTVGHAPGEQGDFVRLELLDPAGARRLLRDLPRQGESCATLSQAIALVVERYFRELAPEDAANVGSRPVPVPVSVPVSVPVPVAAAPADPLTPRLALGVGFGAASAQPGAVAGVQLGAWLTGDLHLELTLLADLGAHDEQLGAAELELRSYPAELGLGFGRRGHAWDFFAGPELRWTLESARGSALRELDSGPGAELSAGVGGGLSWWSRGAFGVTARASLDYAVASTTFRVATATGSEPVLKLPKVQGLLTLGVIFGSRP